MFCFSLKVIGYRVKSLFPDPIASETSILVSIEFLDIERFPLWRISPRSVSCTTFYFYLCIYLSIHLFMYFVQCHSNSGKMNQTESL